MILVIFNKNIKINDKMMFAIVEINGFQFKVYKGKFIYVPYMKNMEKGKIFEKHPICFSEKNDLLNFGNPTLQNYIISFKILEHVKNNKVIIFKKKRRKGYKIKKGHRQKLTKVEILSFNLHKNGT